MDDYKKLQKLLKKCSQYGLISTGQVSTFLSIAAAEPDGLSIAQLSGDSDSQSPASKAMRGQLRKMSKGYDRGENGYSVGLDLVRVEHAAVPVNTWGRKAVAAVRLTARGKRLAAQVDKIMAGS